MRSFLTIRDLDTRSFVDRYLDAGSLWPDLLVQLNPAFKPGATIDELVAEGVLHEECGRIFRRKRKDEPGLDLLMRLHQHQKDAVRAPKSGGSYVLTTGTGSGKSLAYFIPIVDHVLRSRTAQRKITAIVVYPMNALANSQEEELRKFLELGYPPGASPVRFARYTGQESDERRKQIQATPPGILLHMYRLPGSDTRARKGAVGVIGQRSDDLPCMKGSRFEPPSAPWPAGTHTNTHPELKTGGPRAPTCATTHRSAPGLLHPLLHQMRVAAPDNGLPGDRRRLARAPHHPPATGATRGRNGAGSPRGRLRTGALRAG